MSNFGEFIESLFPDRSKESIAEALEIDPSRLGKIMRGDAKPSAENCIRIAAVSGKPPSLVFRAAGLQMLASLTEGWMEATRPVADARLHGRVQRLLDLGMHNEVAAELRRLEAPWEAIRPAFESFVAETGANAARLVVDSPRRSEDTLFELGSANANPRSWTEYSLVRDNIKLHLRLQNPQKSVSRDHVELVLGLWASTLAPLFR